MRNSREWQEGLERAEVRQVWAAGLQGGGLLVTKAAPTTSSHCWLARPPLAASSPAFDKCGLVQTAWEWKLCTPARCGHTLWAAGIYSTWWLQWLGQAGELSGELLHGECTGPQGQSSKFFRPVVPPHPHPLPQQARSASTEHLAVVSPE